MDVKLHICLGFIIILYYYYFDLFLSFRFFNLSYLYVYIECNMAIKGSKALVTEHYLSNSVLSYFGNNLEIYCWPL